MGTTLAMAQTAPAAPAPAASAPAAKKEDDSGRIVVTGRRAALQTAQKIKQEADEVVDSIVAEDMGKLPDKSITEVLQRMVGVTIDRTMAKNDPEHYSVEGSSIQVRGLSFVRSELNGRDTFSANGGRALNFEDVPPELMAGVDVYKNPSAVQIEGAIGGLVNLRTAMPFDHTGAKFDASVSTTYNDLSGKTSPSASLLASNRWATDWGDFGVLVSLATSESKTRTDAFQVEPYFLIDPDGSGSEFNGPSRWVPKGAQWRTLEFQRKRQGAYGALQWRKGAFDSSLTFFQSKYKMNWNEQAIFAQSNPWNIRVDSGATYDAAGVLQRGTLRSPADGGINYGADTRYSDRDSGTKELAWRLGWKPSDRWSFSTDLQLVKSDTESLDSTVATGVQMAKQTIDVSGRVPELLFDAADLASLANPGSYYWAFTMEHRDKSKAESKAWRADGKFSFQDSALVDLQFGIRLNEREATTTNTVPSYNWQAITQPWQVGWAISGLARLNDPRFSGNTYTQPFDNFFGGKRSVPALIMPTPEMAQGYPGTYAQLHKYHEILCQEQTAAQGWGTGCAPWQPASFGTDPSGTNHQKERSQAGYAQLRFDLEDWNLDGNVGVRLVRTEMEAQGYTVFTREDPAAPQGGSVGGLPVPNIPGFRQAGEFSQTYTNALPSLNLRLKAGNNLQFRLGAAQAVARPDFTQLQAYTELKQSTVNRVVDGVRIVDAIVQTGEAKGNPLLKPVRSNQVDLSAEWYFSRTGSLTVVAFNKDLKDVIVNQTNIQVLRDTAGNPYNFVVTSPVNGAKGHARGVEVAFQRYFDMLPGWLSGFGVRANYTYVDSKTKLYQPVTNEFCSGTANAAANLDLNINGCDTNGRAFGGLPLQNLSRNAYNLELLYDQGPVSARVAYSWRSRYLQAVNANGTNGTDGRLANGSSVAWALPVWADDYGQIDAGISYRFDNGLRLSLEGQNLGSAEQTQLMQQGIGFKTRAVFHTGPRYTLQASYSF